VHKHHISDNSTDAAECNAIYFSSFWFLFYFALYFILCVCFLFCFNTTYSSTNAATCIFHFYFVFFFFDLVSRSATAQNWRSSHGTLCSSDIF
jgi:hypothetical protein